MVCKICFARLSLLQSKESQVLNSRVSLSERSTVQLSFKTRLECGNTNSQIRDNSLLQAVPDNWYRMTKGTVSKLKFDFVLYK